MTLSTDLVRDAVEQRISRLGFDLAPLPTDDLRERFQRRLPALEGLHYAITALGVPSALSVWVAAKADLDGLDAARRADRDDGRLIAVNELLVPGTYVIFEITAPPAADPRGKLAPHLRGLVDSLVDLELRERLAAHAAETA